MSDRETVLERIIRDGLMSSAPKKSTSRKIVKRGTSGDTPEWLNYQNGAPQVIVDGIWVVKEHGPPIHGVSVKRDKNGILKVRCSTNTWCPAENFSINIETGRRLKKTCDNCCKVYFPRRVYRDLSH